MDILQKHTTSFPDNCVIQFSSLQFNSEITSLKHKFQYHFRYHISFFRVSDQTINSRKVITNCFPTSDLNNGIINRTQIYHQIQMTFAASHSQLWGKEGIRPRHYFYSDSSCSLFSNSSTSLFSCLPIFSLIFYYMQLFLMCVSDIVKTNQYVSDIAPQLWVGN